MAGCTDLLYFCKNRVIITVQNKGSDKLKMTGGKTFGPEFIATPAPITETT